MTAELAPGFLISAPAMTDDSFSSSIILLLEANEDGAMGFVINQPMDVTLGEIASELRLDIHPSRSQDPAYAGGPLQTERGWLLLDHRDGSLPRYESAFSLKGQIEVITSVDLLGKAFAEPSPRAMRLMLGYAGWGPQQLEAEIREGAWLPLDFDPDLVFSADNKDAWLEALQKLGLSPAFWDGSIADA